mgnify:CR=1 FL=1
MASINKEIFKKIKANKSKWAEEILDYQFNQQPKLKDNYTHEQKEKCLEDINYHLTYLAESISLSSKSLFSNYISWIKVLFKNLNLNKDGLINNFKYTKDILNEKFNEEENYIINSFIKKAIEELKKEGEELDSYLVEENDLYELASNYLDTLLNGSREEANNLIINAVEDGIEIKKIYLNVFQPVQREIGRLWQLNKLSVAKEHYSTSVTQLIMSRLYPYFLGSGEKNCSCITTCAGGELHELGIRMIADLMEMDGWDTIHLGANTPIESIVDEIKEREVDLLGISATIISNLHKVENIINAVRNDSQIANIKIMVGGYPFNIKENLWKEVGADAYAPDLREAVEVANRLCNKG